MSAESRNGIVYTETVVFAPPEQYAADAPYQLAIIDLERGGRLTVRILANSPQERAQIGDRVVFVEERDGVSYYRKPATAIETSETAKPLT
ncbi:MAG TPA: OB-fold domain-containing protein [Bryobacteraceae bacterium]|nr:OB-fold domain-containing protein [Bryobacteraceae bacterium]